MNTPTDDELLALLKDALERSDRVPEDAVRAAKEAWTWRTIDAELAALTFDSAVDAEALAGVRSAATGVTRSLSFEAPDLLIDLEVTEEGQRRSLVGQLAPAGAPAVGIEFADGRPPVVMLTDDLGRFGADRLAPGLLRLRIEPVADLAGASPAEAGGLVTAWVPI